MQDKGKGKASLSPMETVMAEEEKHLQAVSQAIGEPVCIIETGGSGASQLCTL